MIRGFCRAHDDNPMLFNFLLFVQHGQLSKLSEDAPTPVTVMRAVLAGAIALGEIPKQDPDLATALVLGAVLQPATFAAYGRIALKLEPAQRSPGRGRVGRRQLRLTGRKGHEYGSVFASDVETICAPVRHAIPRRLQRQPVEERAGDLRDLPARRHRRHRCGARW